MSATQDPTYLHPWLQLPKNLENWPIDNDVIASISIGHDCVLTVQKEIGGTYAIWSIDSDGNVLSGIMARASRREDIMAMLPICADTARQTLLNWIERES